ncbi:MAG: hypothetical protein UU23_C0001G0051 [Candidatus Curtissbacteria bacterium GW2011_GWA1_40_9]|uniref:N-acetyltransferase n=1 Tax=Candidatus Curtissbacteria bacterium GW2011_GWA1_40_9 TaxID=1618408 RepID=A0A0G0WSC8_9BACT|nr:MAG: hypothetical protein UU23_C0001G0051 [Candidatus Curtissbacteria bacterium GW2011_GWA1_40_9]
MIHETADISRKAKIGKNVTIWSQTQIREGATIGSSCIIGKNVYIDHDVKIGSNVKIQNNAQIFFKTIIENEVFIGPNACLVNDKYPRAAKLGKLKTKKDWQSGTIIIKKGSSIGAGAILLPNVTIGKYSLIGAGSVVTYSIPSYSKLAGNPAKLIGYVCKNGHNLKGLEKNKYYCHTCKKSYKISP